MRYCPPCLSDQGQLYTFPPTGPILLLRQGIWPQNRYSFSNCHPVCIGPKVPQNTVVFFEPKQGPIPPHPPIPPRPRPPRPPVSFGNDEQTCTNTCPDGQVGEPISYTVPENTFFRTTKLAANQAAMQSACEHADALRDATPCVTGFAGVVTIFAKTRAGNPALIGCEEFIPSSPPNYYRIALESGSLWADFSQAFVADCSGFGESTTTIAYGSFLQYDGTSGVATQGGVTTIQVGGNPPEPVVGYTVTCQPFGPDVKCHNPDDAPDVISSINSAVQCQRANQPSVCCQQLTPLGGVQYSYRNFGTQFKTLLDQDLEEDAIQRFRNANAYGDWVECIELPFTPSPTPISCCPTSYQQRTDGREFAYQESLGRVEISDLTPGVEYQFLLEITRTDLATAETVVSGTIAIVDVANFAGQITGEFTMPVNVGFAYKITNAQGSFV